MQEKYFGEQIPKLGFGLMRLPQLADETIDIAQVKQMVDAFMAAGFTYFDTAYVYGNGASELAIKEALVDRYPRESYQLTTKLPVWANTTPEDVRNIFETSMRRTQAGYFDFYLLHNVNRNNVADFERLHVWEYVQELKKQGLVKHAGFSFHDTADMLDELLTKHPEVDFVQLQINYIDWNSDAVQSRKCYEVARKHGKSIIVMEPVKGGALAGLSDEIQSLYRAVRPDLSIPSWAIRFVASLDGIITVLSGMSTLAQMQDNLSYMKDFQPLCAEEYAAIDKAVEILNNTPTVPCTACKYCVDDCPQNINIPEIFKALNGYRVYHNRAKEISPYQQAVGEGGAAKDCLECGLCETHCPQHLEIRELLKEASSVLDEA